MDSTQSAVSWEPARFLSDERSQPPYAVIILNQPLENKHLLINLCRGAIFRACADGGANRLKELCLEGIAKEQCHPDIICGDLDSLLPEVEQYYRKEGSQIIKDPDQYSTDLAKCMKSIHDRICQPLKSYSGNIESSSLQSHHDLDVVIVGGLGGRADQAFSLLHHLYTESEDSSLLHGKLYLVTPESIIFLLHKGPNKIISPVGPDLLGENIGIIPIARPSVITTHGLEWDVSDWCTEFGGQVSTSNHIRSSTVEVETTERVLFTVEIARN